MKSEEPIIILGNPRSGTTLLRLLLTGHPQITIPPECGFIQWWHSKYHGIDITSDQDALINFISDFKESKKIETWHINYESLISFIKRIEPNTYSQLCSTIYEFYSKSRGKNALYWGDKNNYYIEHIPLLKELYPKAKFIHIIRDVRDVACSYLELTSSSSTTKYKPQLPSSVLKIAEEWNVNNEEVQNHLNANILSIRYEDLVAKTRYTLTAICTFLSMPFDINMESNYLSHSDEPPSFLNWKSKTRLSPNESSVGRYKSILNQNQINLLSSECKILLNMYNYAL